MFKLTREKRNINKTKKNKKIILKINGENNDINIRIKKAIEAGELKDEKE